ncbi:MAG: hypothetical protein QM650_16785 [Microlunatus sp.]
MPTTRSPRSRRSVVVALATALLGPLGLLAGPIVPANATPLDSSPLDVSRVRALPPITSPVVGLPDAPSPDTARSPGTGASDNRGLGPDLTLPDDVTFVLGQRGDAYDIEANGDPVPTISVYGLPSGLRLTTYSDGTAILHGTATGPAGVTTVEVRATNADAISSESLTVVVQQRPAFVDLGRLVFRAGVFASSTIRTAGFPAPGIGLDGDLPAGLTFVDNGDGTGTISGTPLGGPESAPITLTAVNEVADVSQATIVEVTTTPGRPTRSGVPTR